MGASRNILVTGGSGFIGSRLVQALVKQGHSVTCADTRRPLRRIPNVSYEQVNLMEEELAVRLVENTDCIIHLAGVPINRFWTASYKRAIHDSRVITTRNLVNSLGRTKRRPEAFICASAIGYYGNAGDTLLDETAKPGTDFLATVCVAWEAEAARALEFGVRTVSIRTSHTLGRGGILGVILKYFRMGLGCWVGRGTEWFPWVHVEDVCRIYMFALENQNVEGVLNTAAPQAVRQKEFMCQVGQVLRKSAKFSLPVSVVRMRYGEMAYIFNTSQHIVSTKLTNLGFKFMYPTLEQALISAIAGM